MIATNPVVTMNSNEMNILPANGNELPNISPKNMTNELFDNVRPLDNVDNTAAQSNRIFGQQLTNC